MGASARVHDAWGKERAACVRQKHRGTGSTGAQHGVLGKRCCSVVVMVLAAHTLRIRRQTLLAVHGSCHRSTRLDRTSCHNEGAAVAVVCSGVKCVALVLVGGRKQRPLNQ